MGSIPKFHSFLQANIINSALFGTSTEVFVVWGGNKVNNGCNSQCASEISVDVVIVALYTYAHEFNAFYREEIIRKTDAWSFRRFNFRICNVIEVIFIIESLKC